MDQIFLTGLSGESYQLLGLSRTLELDKNKTGHNIGERLGLGETLSEPGEKEEGSMAENNQKYWTSISPSNNENGTR